MSDRSLKDSPYENRFHYRTLAVINRLQAKQSRWFADFLPGRRVGLRTLRCRSARRPVLGFWRSEKFRGFTLMINQSSVSLLQVVEEDS